MHKTLFPAPRGESERVDARIKIFNLLLFGSVMGRAVFVLLPHFYLFAIEFWAAAAWAFCSSQLATLEIQSELILVDWAPVSHSN